MNSKWHFIISLIKSCLRIGGSLLVVYQYIQKYDTNIMILTLATSYLVAELLGVLEEVGDKR